MAVVGLENSMKTFEHSDVPLYSSIRKYGMAAQVCPHCGWINFFNHPLEIRDGLAQCHQCDKLGELHHEKF